MGEYMYVGQRLIPLLCLSSRPRRRPQARRRIPAARPGLPHLGPGARCRDRPRVLGHRGRVLLCTAASSSSAARRPESRPRSPKTPDAEIKQDEFFGEVEVYRGRVEVQVPIKRARGHGDILNLEATSQGCADAGLCYPPHNQKILLDLPQLARPRAGPGRRQSPSPHPSPRRGRHAGDEPTSNRRWTPSATSASPWASAFEDDVLQPEEAFKFPPRSQPPIASSSLGHRGRDLPLRREDPDRAGERTRALHWAPTSSRRRRSSRTR